MWHELRGSSPSKQCNLSTLAPPSAPCPSENSCAHTVRRIADAGNVGSSTSRPSVRRTSGRRCRARPRGRQRPAHDRDPVGCSASPCCSTVDLLFSRHLPQGQCRPLEPAAAAAESMMRAVACHENFGPRRPHRTCIRAHPSHSRMISLGALTPGRRGFVVGTRSDSRESSSSMSDWSSVFVRPYAARRSRFRRDHVLYRYSVPTSERVARLNHHSLLHY